jgi:hypothetical protein
MDRLRPALGKKKKREFQRSRAGVAEFGTLIFGSGM